MLNKNMKESINFLAKKELLIFGIIFSVRLQIYNYPWSNLLLY